MQFKFIILTVFVYLSGCSNAPHIKDYSNKLTLPATLLTVNNIVDPTNVVGLLDAGNVAKYETCIGKKPKPKPRKQYTNSEIRDCSLLASAKQEVPIENVLGVMGRVDDIVRRQILIAAYAKSDRLCDAYMSEVITQSKVTKSSMGVGGLALAVLAGVNTHAQSANQLANGGAFLIGARDELSNTILGGDNTDLHYRAVRVRRLEEREKAQQMLDVADYDGLQLHIVNYHALCGIVHGKSTLEAAVSTKEDQVEVSQIKSIAELQANRISELQKQIVEYKKAIQISETELSEEGDSAATEDVASP